MGLQHSGRAGHRTSTSRGRFRRHRLTRVALGLAATTLATAGTVVALPAAATPAGASTAYTPPACNRPKPAPVVATPVAGVSSDWTITSFDGTKLRAHWFPATGASASHKDPTLLMGPGWGLAGATLATPLVLGALDISTLNHDGYNVLTWDPRGFGDSGGTIEVDSPNYEAKDVSKLIDWVATQPQVQLTKPGDPRVGMVGGSYGGGIQFVTAAQDCRVDAIAPTIAWHSLVTSLYKANTVKIGWATELYHFAPAGHVDPTMTAAYQSGITTGMGTPAEMAWFVARGPGDLVKKIKVPTLIIQGTVDNLFTLQEGVTNYEAIKANGVPTHMIWFCGGHGVCLTPQGDPNYITDATVAWMNRWLKGQSSANVGPAVDIIDQHGTRYAASTYPLPTGAPVTATGSGTLTLTATGGSGPAIVPAGEGGAVGAVAGIITPAKAANAVNVTVHAPSHSVLVVGAPKLTLTYQGTVPAGTRPTRVFAQLVDDSTGLVVGNQVTPIDVTLDGHTHTTTLPLELVSQAMAPGQRLTLQLVATTVAYATPRLGGTVAFHKVALVLPTAKGVTPAHG